MGGRKSIKTLRPAEWSSPAVTPNLISLTKNLKKKERDGEGEG